MVIRKETFTKETLRRLQLTELEILDEIVRICNKHDLRYYLAEGTLLGAARHQGFIPWDDDLDIAMPREDYERFLRLCETELDARFFAHSHYTDENYWLIFAKIRKKGTAIDEHSVRKLSVPKGIYVDVFPLDCVTTETDFWKRMRTQCIKKMYALIAYKKGLDLPITSWRRTILFLTKPLSIRHLSRFAERLMRKQNHLPTYYFVNYGSYYDTVQQTILKSKYEPAAELMFEGKPYTVPKEYDYVLRRAYGDYMQLPPEEKRVLQHKPESIDFGD
jgi:lipopolysaccharide cholinephosphotransferase